MGTKAQEIPLVQLTERERRIHDLLWFNLKRDPEHKDRRQTGFGTKTVIGLTASVERIIEETSPLEDGTPRPQMEKVVAVLREFMRDVEAIGAKQTGVEWPDLLITYNKARMLNLG